MENFLSVKEVAVLWNLSERSVRNYCSTSRIEGAILDGKTWFIPKNAAKPTRINEMKNKNHLLNVLRSEKKHKFKGGIYHYLQIKFTYNSNHIEGSKLTEEETEFIFNTRTIDSLDNKSFNVDDIIETINHFKCIVRVIDFANYELSEVFIKELHGILKYGIKDSSNPYFKVGEYKAFPNSIGTTITTDPKLIHSEMTKLLEEYNLKKKHSFEEIADFHVKFERIHPFSDGNGRVGRLIMLKECLKNNIIPIIVDEELKRYYYRGIKEWNHEKGFLLDTLKAGQDKVRKIMDHFWIPYKNI